jgi:hypothetical protein
MHGRPFCTCARSTSTRKRRGVRTRKDSTSLFFNTRTEEELIADVMSEIGPCVAIGRPGEKLPELGFTRLYIGDEKWQEAVLQFMRRAQLVIIMGGSSRNYAWEVGKALELVEPHRLLFLIPSDANELVKFHQTLGQTIQGFDRQIPNNAIFPAQTFKAILYFDRNGTLHYARAETPSHFCRALTTDIRPALKMSLRPIYEQLAVKWSPPPLVLSRMLYESALLVCAIFFILVVSGRL